MEYEWHIEQSCPLNSTLFMKHLTAAALRSRIVLCPMWHRRRNHGIVASDCEAVTYRLETYETDDMSRETDADVVHFVQLSNSLAIEFS